MAQQGNPIWGKESQEQEKVLEMYLLLLLWVTQKHQANSHNISTEDMIQTHAGP